MVNWHAFKDRIATHSNRVSKFTESKQPCLLVLYKQITLFTFSRAEVNKLRAYPPVRFDVLRISFRLVFPPRGLASQDLLYDYILSIFMLIKC